MAAAAEAMWAAPAAFRLLRAAASKTVAVARQKFSAAARPLVNAAPTKAASASTATATAVVTASSSSPAATSAASYAQRPSKTADDILRRFFSSVTSSAPAAGRATTTQPASIAQETFARFRKSTGRAPFATTLRPSLTGGAFPRSAGGYGLGAGNARYFSHSPTASAEVISNVSQAMRAFTLNGKRAKYDGTTPRGDKRYRTVSAAEDDAARKVAAAPRFAPGAFIDYRITPTVTALSPLLADAFPYAAASPEAVRKEVPTLNQEGLLDLLAGDFERAARDLSTVLTDLKRLAHLGDLPITLEGPSLLRVRFPGVDADTVERLCEDTGVRRGYIGQDAGFDASAGVEMALKFPFAPDGGVKGAKKLSSPGGSLRSLTGHEMLDESDGFLDDDFLDEFELNAWLSDPEGYSSGPKAAEGFEGLEGIYRFLEECDRAQGRY